MTGWEGPDAITLDGFTWDEGKNQSNIEKHGVDFDEAATCFSTGREKRFARSRLKGEVRWILQGSSDLGRPLTVIFRLDKVKKGTVARIISAWRQDR